MEPPRQKLFARIALVVLAVLGLCWLSRVDFSRKISTNVIDLIPKDEQSPEITLLRSLADERQARIMLFVLSDAAGGPRLDAAATEFAQTLHASPLFAEATPLRNSQANDTLGKFLFERRFDYLLPAWLAEQDRAFVASGRPEGERSQWLARRVVKSIDEFLQTPEAPAFQEILPRDPLLLVPSLILKTQALSPAASGDGGNRALVWARLSVSPLDEAGQQPVFDTVDQALAQLHQAHANVKLEWTGVNRFAAASKERIRAELSWLNILSIGAVLLVAIVFVRQTWKAFHLVPVILFSLLGGWVAATMIFDRLHILVFVVGALLTGVAIDYGFYLYLQPALRAGELYREKLARLAKPLLTSCLTTVLGFSFLLFSELPLIRQLGVFVSAGLVSALGAAMLYFAQLDHPYLDTREFVLTRFATRRPLLVRVIGIVALIVAVVGPWRLQWLDNIRQLDVPNTELNANDREIREQFGDSEAHAVYITRGATPAEARDRLEKFIAWHAAQFPDTNAASIGQILPTKRDFEAAPARLSALPDFDQQLGVALEKGGYTAESFEPFFASWRDVVRGKNPPAYAALTSELQAKLTGPLGMLFFTGEQATWFMTIADHAPGLTPPAELGTVGTNQLETLNTLFARYRASALRLSAAGLGLIGLSVFVLYGLRRGLRIFMIPAGACLIGFGVLGLSGQTLNMFHLLGAFLGVCLSHNYAIFSAENSGRGEAPPASIRLSALTTAASFGVLGLSKIAVVAALGTTVALIVMIALIMVELEPLSRKPALAAS